MTGVELWADPRPARRRARRRPADRRPAPALADAARREALLLTGTVGVGKTSVAEAVGDLLREAEVPNAVVDVDWLRAAWPPPPGDPFNQAVALRNLAAVGANYLDAGAARLVLAGVVETRRGPRRARRRPRHAADGRAAWSPTPTSYAPGCCAGTTRTTSRAAGTCTGPASSHAIQERSAVEDHRVDTSDLSVRDVAAVVLRRVGWTGPLS